MLEDGYDTPTMEDLLSHTDVGTTMNCTHDSNREWAASEVRQITCWLRGRGKVTASSGMGHVIAGLRLLTWKCVRPAMAFEILTDSRL